MKFALTTVVSIWALAPVYAQSESDVGLLVHGEDRDLQTWPMDPTGSCCAPSGNPLCVDDQTEAACDAFGGTWLEGGDCAFDCDGACCTPDFQCSDLSQDSCVHPQNNGTFIGFGTDCATLVTCPTPSPTTSPTNAPTTPPTPAPTTAAPTKSPTMAPTTAAPTPVATPSPTKQEDGPGACCTPWDGCRYYSKETCELKGGSRVGAYVPCERALCPNRGACCKDGGCSYEYKRDCNVAGGDFQGLGVMCGAPGTVCPTNMPTYAPTPSPTPAPTSTPTKEPTTPAPTSLDMLPGACCIPGFDICADITKAQCDLIQGNFKGFGTDCDTANICTITDSPTPSPTVQPSGVGGCCFPGIDVCLTASYESCVILNNGQFLGDGVPCGNTQCPLTAAPTPAPAPGVCCLTLKTGQPYCLDKASVATCANNGGEYVPDAKCSDVQCPLTPSPTPAPQTKDEGACCFEGDDQCYASSLESCVLFNKGQFFGFGSKCENIKCNGSNPQTPQPTPSPNVTKGACCLAHGRCLPLRSGNCYRRGGHFLGLGSICGDGNTCPSTPRPTPSPTPRRTPRPTPRPTPGPTPKGACCLKTGRCLSLRPGNCKRRYGEYFDGIPCAPNNTCPTVDEPGSCCFPDKGVCRNGIKGSVCADRGGNFGGPGSRCNKKICPAAYGGCCLPDDSCMEAKPAFCEKKGGKFAGLDTVCVPGLCPLDIRGACCLGKKGKCIFVKKAKCWEKGGKFKGPGVQCGNVCPVY